MEAGNWQTISGQAGLFLIVEMLFVEKYWRPSRAFQSPSLYVLYLSKEFQMWMSWLDAFRLQNDSWHCLLGVTWNIAATIQGNCGQALVGMWVCVQELLVIYGVVSMTRLCKAPRKTLRTAVASFGCCNMASKINLMDSPIAAYFPSGKPSLAFQVNDSTASHSCLHAHIRCQWKFCIGVVKMFFSRSAITELRRYDYSGWSTTNYKGRFVKSADYTPQRIKIEVDLLDALSELLACTLSRASQPYPRHTLPFIALSKVGRCAYKLASMIYSRTARDFTT